METISAKGAVQWSVESPERDSHAPGAMNADPGFTRRKTDCQETDSRAPTLKEHTKRERGRKRDRQTDRQREGETETERERRGERGAEREGRWREGGRKRERERSVRTLFLTALSQAWMETTDGPMPIPLLPTKREQRSKNIFFFHNVISVQLKAWHNSEEIAWYFWIMRGWHCVRRNYRLTKQPGQWGKGQNSKAFPALSIQKDIKLHNSKESAD